MDEEEVSHFTIGLSIGYQQNRMNDYNENIDVLNHFLFMNQGIRQADHFKGSAAGRGEVRYKFGQRLSVGFGISNTESKSAFDVTFGAVDFYARATAWSPMVYYHLPFVQTWDKLESVADRASFYVGGGLVLLTNGMGHMRVTDRTTEPSFRDDGDLIEFDGQGEVRGSGAGFQGLIGASYQVTSRVSFAGEVGYRWAKITDLEITRAEGFERAVGELDPDRREPLDQAIIDFFRREGRPPGFPDRNIEGEPIPYYSGGPIELDFTGFQTQVGIRFHLF